MLSVLTQIAVRDKEDVFKEKRCLNTVLMIKNPTAPWQCVAPPAWEGGKDTDAP